MREEGRDIYWSLGQEDGERSSESRRDEESRGREPEEFGIMKIDGGRGRERMREERRRNIEDMLETRHQEDGVMSWSHEERRGEERDRGVQHNEDRSSHEERRGEERDRGVQHQEDRERIC